MPFVQAGSHRLEYFDSGKGDTVVLIHGAGSSALIWDTVQNNLANNFRVISISLPGAGQSDRPDDLSVYSPGSYGNDINLALKQLDINRFAIVGHSLGVSNILALVDEYGSDFDVWAMIMMAGGAGGPRAAPTGSEIEAIKTSWPLPDPATADKRRAAWEKLHQGLKAKIRDALWTDIQNNPMQRALGQRISARPDRTKFLNNTKIPTLIVSGDHDSVVPLELTLAMYPKLAAGVRHLHVVHGVDHYPNAEVPDEISRVYLQFLTAQQSVE